MISAAPASLQLEMLVGGFIQQLERSTRYTDNTRQAYTSDLRCFLEALESQLGRSPTLDDFRPELLKVYFASQAQQGQSRNTLIRRKATLKKFHRYLVQNGYTLANFPLRELEAIELPDGQSRENPASIRPLSSAEINRLLNQMENARLPRTRRDQALFLLVVELGLPVNRLVSLDLADVDLAAGTLRPRADMATRVALGTAAEYLARYLVQGRPDLNPNPEDPALFISQFGGRLSRQGVWQILEHWGQASGLAGLVSPRALRYTAAARLLHAGRSLDEIHLLLGHSNLLSTQAFLRRLSQAPPAAAVPAGPLFLPQPADTAAQTRQ